MKNHLVLVGAALLSVAAAGAVSFPLEWSVAYPVDVPYEVEVSPARLARLPGVSADSGYAVTASTPKGKKQLAVTVAAGRTGETIALRFTVPAGTTALSCTCDAAAKRIALPESENLFAQKLVPSAWKASANAEVVAENGGIVVRSLKGGDIMARCRVALPPELAGKPAKIEIDVVNLGKMTTGGTIRFAQYDASGKELAESVGDPRWTSHMRPPNKPVALREEGRFHPQARTIELCVESRALYGTTDEYGLPITSPSDLWPALGISRVALRAAARLPFPRYDDSFFSAGVSAAAGDTALQLGPDRAFWYCTHSRGCWAEGRQFDRPTDVFWPDNAGTVEAWLKPAWADTRTYDIFTASHRYNSNDARMIQPKNECFTLKYRPDRKMLDFVLLDWNGKKFSGSAQAELPAGAWTHVAFQWQPEGAAELFVNGRRVASVPLTGFESWELSRHSDVKPNGRIPLEFYIGANYSSGRITPGFPGEKSRWYPGAVDNLRVSSGCRYAGDFRPATAFSSDADTRALFTFDRSFDGASGGGWGWIPGTILAPTDRVQHRLAASSGAIDYFPAENTDANNPFKVFSTLNYPVLPMAEDFRAARRTLTKTMRMKTGEEAAFDCPPSTVPEFIEIANVGTKALVHPVVINQGEFDPRSFGDLADSLMRGRENLSDRERANALFRFVLGASDYFMQHTITFPPESDRPEMVVYKALTMLNGYCGFECGPLNSMTANLLACVARCPASSTYGYGHEFQQVFFDGKNHTYDLSAQKFFPAMDNETASCLGESEDQPGIYNRIGGDGGSFIRSYTRAWSRGVPALQPKIALTLNPGERFRVWQGNDGNVNDLHIHGWRPGEVKEKSSYTEDYAEKLNAKLRDPVKQTVVRMDRFFPHYLNGFIVFDERPRADNPAFSEITDSSFVYKVASCYPIVHGEYSARRADGSAVKVELSTDGGKTYRPVTGALDYEVRARSAYRLRVKAPIGEVAQFTAATEVMVNPRVHPGKLRAGANKLLFKATSGEGALVTAAWRERVKSIEIKGGVHAGVIPGFEHQFVFLEPGKPQALEVAGLSAAARATVRALKGAFGKAPVTATLAGGKLTLALDGNFKGSAIASVRIADGEAVKDVYVLASSSLRFVPAAAARLDGGARLIPASENQIQATVGFDKSGNKATFKFAPVPAGNYTVFMLDRFASDLKTPSELNRSYFRVDWPGRTDKAKVYGGSGGNQGINLYKARYGNLEGRAQFKWDFILDNVGYHPYFPRYNPRQLAFAEGTSEITFIAEDARTSLVELAAVVVVPPQEREFFCAFVKLLCGMNCEPARVGY